MSGSHACVVKLTSGVTSVIKKVRNHFLSMYCIIGNIRQILRHCTLIVLIYWSAH